MVHCMARMEQLISARLTGCRAVRGTAVPGVVAVLDFTGAGVWSESLGGQCGLGSVSNHAFSQSSGSALRSSCWIAARSTGFFMIRCRALLPSLLLDWSIVLLEVVCAWGTVGIKVG